MLAQLATFHSRAHTRGSARAGLFCEKFTRPDIVYSYLFMRLFSGSYSASFTFISDDARVQWPLPVPRDHYQPASSSLVTTPPCPGSVVFYLQDELARQRRFQARYSPDILRLCSALCLPISLSLYLSPSRLYLSTIDRYCALKRDRIVHILQSTDSVRTRRRTDWTSYFYVSAIFCD